MNVKILSAILLSAMIGPQALAASSSASYTLESSVIGAAGGIASSASYTMSSTLGQSSPIGTSQAAGYTLEAGFWHPEPELVLDGDANGDCKVNIIDLIYIRNRLNKDPGTGDNASADVNGDGKINIIDLIYVRNRLNDKCE